MGAGQSAEGRNGQAAGDAAWEGGPSAKDYYALLGVEQDAEEADIRKAYRKLALQHHPDKNPGHEEEANRRFHVIQAAYEVLSDSQERAWYDAHKDDVLGEDEEDDITDAAFEDLRTGKAQHVPVRASAPGLSVKHLLRFFDPSIATGAQMSGPSADESGFFGTYRRLFERLAEEEQKATPYPGEENGEPLEYPPFGYSHTPYANIKGEEAPVHQTPVKEFYSVWMGFSSRKSFGWFDGHRTTDAPDRRIKRLMEKDNKKARDAARKEYNETIRSLTAFLRKRDPRFKAWQERQANGPEAQKRAQQSRQDANRKMQERKAAAEKFLEESQDWQRAEELINSEFEDSDDYSEEDEEEQDSDATDADQEADDIEAEEEEEDEGPSTWACVACDKYFQSEPAWLNHEKSKKHRSEVKRLKREMQADEAEFGFAAEGAVEEGEGADDASAGLALPTSGGASSKKAKKKQRKQQKAQQALDGDLLQREDSDEERLNLKPALSAALEETPEQMHQRAVGTATPDGDMGPPPDRPPGSFDVFGYGSLIFKPPPHALGRTPGFIKGFARRFAQHSIDHRGTPERPGRVVTLITAADWHSFAQADDAPEGDIVWGYSYTIDPAHAEKVKAYLDWREKNGYTEQRVTVWKSETEVVVEDALVYVGLPDNEAFVGPSDLDELALRIYTCEGPSGRNDEYLLNLAEAVRKLAPQVEDSHLFRLEEKVLALRAAAAEGEGKAQNGVHADKHAAEDGKKARRQQKKELGQKKGKSGEICNVCKTRFSSRSKLFNHIRESGHAAAQAVEKEEWEQQEGSGEDDGPPMKGSRGRGKRKK